MKKKENVERSKKDVNSQTIKLNMNSLYWGVRRKRRGNCLIFHNFFLGTFTDFLLFFFVSFSFIFYNIKWEQEGNDLLWENVFMIRHSQAISWHGNLFKSLISLTLLYTHSHGKLISCNFSNCLFRSLKYLSAINLEISYLYCSHTYF